MQVKPEVDRSTRWFLLGSALYFLIQAIQRTVMGGTLEVDEAEMLVMGQHFALGYGPQLPLYNWVQVLAFWIFGPTTAGLAFLKDTVLWLAATGLWFAMHAAFADRRAAATAALSLAFLPNVLWEFQRASTHSVALLAAITWTLWGWFRLMQRQDMQRWLGLGLLMGLGGLSKANYWVVPAGLALAGIGLWQARIQWRGVIAAGLLAISIVAVPYYWAATHPSATLASVYKFYGDQPPVWPWLLGLARLAGNYFAGLLLPLLIWVPLWVFAARERMGPLPMAAKLLFRVVALNLVVASILIVTLDITKIQARWLVPILLCTIAAGFGWLGAALSARAFRAVPIIAVICGALTVVGMAGTRLGETGSRDMTPVLDLATRLKPDRVEGTFFLVGNLELLDPSFDVTLTGTTPATGDWPARLLILGPLPPGVQPRESGTLELFSPAEPGEPLLVEWHLVTPPA